MIQKETHPNRFRGKLPPEYQIWAHTNEQNMLSVSEEQMTIDQARYLALIGDIDASIPEEELPLANQSDLRFLAICQCHILPEDPMSVEFDSPIDQACRSFIGDKGLDANLSYHKQVAMIIFETATPT